MREGWLLLIDDTGHDWGDGIGMMLDTLSEASALLHTVLGILVDILLLWLGNARSFANILGTEGGALSILLGSGSS